MHRQTAGVPAPGAWAEAPRPGVWLTDVTLFLMAVIWGGNFAVAKYATGVMPPLAFNAVRVTIAAATLLAIAAFIDTPWPPRRLAAALVGLGALGNGVYQIFFIEGVSRARAGDAALLIAATPAFIALIGRIRGVERIGPRGWGGIALSILGIGLVTGTAVTGHGSASMTGNLLMLGASLTWAIFTVLLKPHMHGVAAVKLSALTMAGGALLLVLVSSGPIASVDWGATSVAAWGAILYGSIGALVVAYFFWNRGVRILGPTRTAMYSNIQPVIALLIAWALIGEVPTLWQALGATSIISGLVLART